MTKGFTLIELLIVIGILAILATTVVLVLNPAQLLAETRDTQRISDMDTVRSALNLYLTTSSSPDLDDTGPGVCGADWWASNVNGTTLPAAGSQPFATPATTEIAQQIATAQIRDVDGDGWIPVDLVSVPGGSPLSSLPVDPNADLATALTATPGGRFYAYQCNNTNKTYELNVNFESTKYNNFTGATGAAITGPETSDGGTSLFFYEVGNAAGLAL